MAPRLVPLLLLAAALALAPLAAAQQQQRNIQTRFPPTRTPAFPTPPPPTITPPAASPATSPPGSPGSLPSSSSSSSVKRSDIAVAVVSTALSSFAVSGLAFFVFLRHAKKKDLTTAGGGGNGYPNGLPQEGALPEKRSPKRPPRGTDGIGMVDENGLDAIYWREFEKDGAGRGGRKPTGSWRPPQPPPPRQQQQQRAERWPEPQESSSPSPPRRSRKSRIDQEPLIPRGSLDSASAVFDESPRPPSASSSSSSFSVDARPPVAVSAVPRPSPAPASSAAVPPSASPSLPPPPGRASPQTNPFIAAASSAPPPPPPPKPAAASSPPPPPPKAGPPPPPPPKGPPAPPPPRGGPPPPPLPKGKSPPPPPPPGGKKGGPPPPPPKGGARPPTAPGMPSGAAEQQAKLKPLHWDKVNVQSTDHSMVWDKITAGSFNLDEGTIEALFGTGAANRKPKSEDSKDSSGESSAGLGRSNTPEQIFLLEPRKSHNISIILKSLTVGRDEIIDALRDGHTELSTEVLEKLSRLSISKEEESTILKFSGNPDRLAPAEAFLLRLLLDVPSPFARVNALLFKVNYSAEVAQLKQSLRTLEMASQELRTKGLFFKLLEAVLKAGNRMNAGTARGNAQAFNLTALRKLSDVKSTDGTTTLLHFVVEEVVRSEGKRLAINRNYSLRHSGSLRRSGSLTKSGHEGGSSSAREERQNEYMNLGLPIVGGLSSEFANVKKAAVVDYDSVVSECAILGSRLVDIKRLLETCGDDGFARGLRGFVKAAEQELSALRGEQDKVLDLVQRTTEYYHAGATKDKKAHPLQLFIVVRDFLGMVDQACVDIKRKLQQKKPPPSSSQPTTALPPTAPVAPAAAETKEATDGQAAPAQKPPEEADSRRKRVMPRFPNLPAHFMKDNAESDSSSDEE
ncbi:hypothetical protein PR202_gb09773 [Eleusine coracana subsp. coracana]|uniref:Formin-like protein n=1 Tax=Eleusine coracana subsp. coracana TaxID=191504 RepID=A0AAV5EGF5_ELECO|nr:hypothetical protein QOZ80_2BG0200520 [Eleusine coracana subsp. coracana]GJN22224.1 hypothetical protein PR202_gb09773 [Eleusine coracana subsp. coracana]